MALRAVIFDCFGVLVHGSLGYLVTLTPPERRAELRDLNRSSDYGYISLQEYVEGIAALTERTPAEIHEIIRTQHLRDERMVEYVREVRGRGLQTALLSNVARDVMDELFAPAEQAELFDTVVLSSSVGMTKPSAEIYLHTTSLLGVQPDEAVMVDDLESNTEGARRAGLHAIQFATVEQLQGELGRLGV